MLTISSQPRYAFSAIAIASRLALNARRSCLVCALHSSKDDPSNWVLDWHVSQYLYINVVDADPFPLIGRLGLLDFSPSGEYSDIHYFISSGLHVVCSIAYVCMRV